MVIVHLERKKRLTAMDTIPIRGNVQSSTFNHCIICLLKMWQFVQQIKNVGWSPFSNKSHLSSGGNFE